MKINKIKIISILLLVLSIFAIETDAYAHSGRTDSSGGHRDNKNKSGLGNYHYHCGGYPAHLHTNGICPYSSSSTSSGSSTSSSATSSSKPINTEPSTIDVTGVQINENVESLEVGKSITLTATITPSNATDKKITWKSSNENIATVSKSGKVTAKNYGVVTITAISSNGNTSTIKMNIKESQKAEKSYITNSSATNKDSISNNTIASNKEDSNPLVGILLLGALGGGGYIAYKKHKK